MLGLLVPDLYLKSIYALDPARLRRRGIRGLIVDLDNTLVAWRTGQADERLEAWVRALRAAGIEPCIVSNNRVRRVTEIARRLGVPAVSDAAKPRRGAFRKAMERLGVGPEETAVLGDQLFTDVLGGKRLGLFTILVVPISRREFIWTRLVRRVERWVLSRMAGQGLLGEPHD